MKFDEKKIVELLLGLIFIVLVLILVVLVLNPLLSDNASESRSPVQTSVQNSKNTININNYNSYIESPILTSRTVYGDRGHKYHNNHKKIQDGSEKNNGEGRLKYSSYGEHEREETYFSNYKDTFRVHVVNKDYQGGYFKVKFAFCDYYNNCISRTVQKYVPAKEEIKFVYLDIQSERYKYYEWEYKIIAPKRG